MIRSVGSFARSRRAKGELGSPRDPVRMVRRGGQEVLLVRCLAGRKISGMAEMLRHRFLQRSRAFPPRTSAVRPSRRCGICLLRAVLRWSRWYGDHPRDSWGAEARRNSQAVSSGVPPSMEEPPGSRSMAAPCAAMRRELAEGRIRPPPHRVSMRASSLLLPWTHAGQWQVYSLSASGLR